LAVLGDNEWFTLQLYAYRQHVSDCHRRAREPWDLRKYLADAVWDRVRSLRKTIWLSPWKPSTGEPAPGKGSGSFGGLDLPEAVADVEVAMRALRLLYASWPEGFAVARRSLEDEALASDGSKLARVKLWLLAAVRLNTQGVTVLIKRVSS